MSTATSTLRWPTCSDVEALLVDGSRSVDIITEELTSRFGLHR
jgi:hypothetical protein